MTVREVIGGFREGAEENAEREAYANELFQETVRIGMELNTKYHTPEEIREIMGRLIGKKVDRSFRMFPPMTVVGGVPAKVLKKAKESSGTIPAEKEERYETVV